MNERETGQVNWLVSREFQLGALDNYYRRQGVGHVYCHRINRSDAENFSDLAIFGS